MGDKKLKKKNKEKSYSGSDSILKNGSNIEMDGKESKIKAANIVNDDSMDYSEEQVITNKSKKKKKKGKSEKAETDNGYGSENEIPGDQLVEESEKKTKKKKIPNEHSNKKKEFVNGLSALTVTRSDDITGNDAVEIDKKKKKKKKSDKGNDECIVDNEEISLNHIDTGNNVDFQKKKRKKKKSDKGNADTIEEVFVNHQDTSSSSNNLDSKKELRKNKTSEKGDANCLVDTNEEISVNDLDTGNDVDFQKKRKKKKKANKEKLEGIDTIGKDISIDHSDDTSNNSEIKKKKNKSDKRVCVHEDSSSEKSPNISDAKREKVNRKRNKPNEEFGELTLSSSDNCSVEEIKKKKRKKNKLIKENELINQSVSLDIEEQTAKDSEKSGKKKKRKSKELENNSYEIETLTKKMKKKMEQVDEKVEKTFDSKSKREQPLNHSWSSPVFVNEERQEKFKRLLGGNQLSSKKEKHSISSSSPVKNNELEKTLTGNEISENSSSQDIPVAGQWKGVLFENTERQNKFLRLLGGAKSSSEKKKGLFSSNTSAPKKGLFGSLASKMTTTTGLSSMGGGNQALNLQAAASLNRNLEDDYNRALSRKLGGLGSSGIGFVKDPAEGKKFHIDINATKSMKFNDDDD